MTKEYIADLIVAEANLYNQVREHGFNKGRDVEVFQKAVDGKASGEPWCFTGDTEILTEDGWIRFDELQKGALVAQVDDKRNLTFVEPTAYIKKEYNNTGWHIKTRSIDLICDKNHRFYGRFNNAMVSEFGTLDKVTTSLSVDFPVSASAGINLNNSQLEFLAAFLSDGFISKTRQGKPRIRVQVSKERKVKLLGAMDYVGMYTASKVYGISKTPLTTFSFEVPTFFNEVFSEYKEMKWDFVNSFSCEQAKVFLNSYLNFDGHVKSGSNMVFSSRKELADQLLTLCLMAGYAPAMKQVESKLSGRPSWIVRWSNDRDSKHIKKAHLTEVELNETLYCVSVPNERILVRGKGGTPLVVGNCMCFVQFIVKKVALDLGIRSPLFQSEHCQTVWNNTLEMHKSKVGGKGMIALWRKRGTTNGHTGICLDAGAVYFNTIEGNTNEAGSREGDGVYKKKRLMVGGKMELRGFIDAPQMIYDKLPQAKKTV